MATGTSHRGLIDGSTTVSEGGAFDRVGPERARIGPNAIIQLEMALREQVGAVEAREIFSGAGLLNCMARPPSGMVNEQDVARLHHEVRWRFGGRQAQDILADAGDRTGRYILDNRIPAPVVVLLHHLPAFASSRLLMKAIEKHAWTFAGSGQFEMMRDRLWGGPIVARIVNNPVVMLDRSAGPICAWHAAVFRRLFRDLVDSRSQVMETECCAAGAAACRFEIRVR